MHSPHSQRTTAMAVIGILHIVTGSLTCVGALINMLGGGLVAAIGSAAEHEMNGASGQAAMVGGALILFGIVGLAFGAGLLAAGVGVLKVKPWGRSLSLAAAALGITFSLGQALILGAFGVGTIVGMIYPLVLFALFMTPAWKSAFVGRSSAPAASAGAGELRYRDAA